MTLVLIKEHDHWTILAAQNGSAEDRATMGFADVRAGDVALLPEPAAADRVQATLDAFDGAWNRRDRSGLARLFATGADFVDTAARWVQGDERIAAHLVDVARPGLGHAARGSGVDRLTLIQPDLAWAQLRWNLRAARSSAVARQGMGLRVLQRSGAAWRILATEDTLIRASGHP